MKNLFYFLGILATLYGAIMGLVTVLTNTTGLSNTSLFMTFLGIAIVGIANILENQQKILKILKNNK